MFRGLFLSQYLKIEIEGRDGSNWIISGPGKGDGGVILKPRVSQLIDTPVKTLFVPGPFGEEYAGKRVQRREMVFTVQVGSEEMTPEEWAEADAAWRWAWDYEEESTMTVTVYDDAGEEVSSRYMKLRLLEEPKSYGDKDPFIHGDDEVVMTVTATFPYWRAEDRIYEYSTGGALVNAYFNIVNDGDVPVWPRWNLTAPGRWTLPDYSWGNDQYSRGAADATRTVQLPLLPPGAHASVDSDPRVQTIICVNEFPAMQQWKGKDLLYPIMPGVSASVPVSANMAAVGSTPVGAAVQLRVPRWYSRPWSSPVVLT